MSEAIVVPPGGGEVVGDAPDRRVEILAEHDALHATWSRFGPGRDGADLHVHHRHTDLFYVLEGELTVRLGVEGETVPAAAGTLVCVPPLVVHGFRNGGADAEVRYLNLHAPGQGFANYMRGVRDAASPFDQADPPADGGHPTSEAAVGDEGFVVDRTGLRAVLLADGEAIGIAEVSADPGSPDWPPHLHRAHVESLYVLAGELEIVAGERRLRVAAGSWVEVPPRVPHSISFPGPEAVRYLELHTPGCGFGDFLRALSDAGDEEAAAALASFDQHPAALA